jgi:hypothetical protein
MLIVLMFLQVALVVVACFVWTWFGREIPGEAVIGVFGFFSAEGLFLSQLKKLERSPEAKAAQKKQDAERKRLTDENAKLRKQLEKIHIAVGDEKDA